VVAAGRPWDRPGGKPADAGRPPRDAKPLGGEFLHELGLFLVQPGKAHQQLDRLGDRALSCDPVPFRMSFSMAISVGS
jgi:hypothetical protein